MASAVKDVINVIEGHRNVDDLTEDEYKAMMGALDGDNLGEGDFKLLEAALEEAAAVSGGAVLTAETTTKVICALDDIDKECQLCMEEYEENEFKMVMPCCGYVGHADCVIKVVKSTTRCPQCSRKASIPIPETDYKIENILHIEHEFRKQENKHEFRKQENKNVSVLWKRIKYIKKDLDRWCKYENKFSLRGMRAVLRDRWFDSEFEKKIHLKLFNVLFRLLENISKPRCPDCSHLHEALDNMASTDYFKSIISETDTPSNTWADECYRGKSLFANNWFLATSIAAITEFKLDIAQPEAKPDNILTHYLSLWVRDVLIASKYREDKYLPRTHIQTYIGYERELRYVDIKYLIPLAFLVINRPHGLARDWKHASTFLLPGVDVEDKEVVKVPPVRDEAATFIDKESPFNQRWGFQENITDCVNKVDLLNPKPVDRAPVGEPAGDDVKQPDIEPDIESLNYALNLVKFKDAVEAVKEERKARARREEEAEARRQEAEARLKDEEDLAHAGGFNMRAKAKAGGGAVALVVLAAMGALLT